MESMWRIQLDDIATEFYPPEDIVARQCKLLQEQTNGNVVADIERYSEEGLADILLNMNYQHGIKKRPIHATSLGDDGNIRKAFLFYITSPKTPKYKFKVMFFKYFQGQYPVEIILEEKVSLEVDESNEITCYNEEEFNEILRCVLQTREVASVVRALDVIAKKKLTEEAV